eukprot:TRINITY_DN14401_c0_g1_i1.p1 TRINITY_DN14401_c0_g1~~TRINITY_DN14401_c0_g1_i1.p1  ORF type:complete len:603 (+),score=192.34 TRINITY_DN14401_c0_g1_i1:122-1810(+)
MSASPGAMVAAADFANLTSFEATAVRFPNTSAEVTPGPGAYFSDGDGGISGDKKKWLNAATWSKGTKPGGLDYEVEKPGPASYEQGTTLGHQALPTMETSTRVLFGNAVRFGKGEAECAVHAYQELPAAASPSAQKRKSHGTFAARHEVYRVDETPGPKYSLKGLADEAEALPRTNFMGSGAERFPTHRAKSPGPVYSLPSTLRKGAKLPPKASSLFFQDLLANHKRLWNAPDKLRDQVTRSRGASERGGTPTAARGGDPSDGGRTVVLKTGGGARVVNADGLLEGTIDRASGGRMGDKACSFGQKTMWDTAVNVAGMANPGPQDYNVSEGYVRKSTPGYTFGPKKGAPHGYDQAHFGVEGGKPGQPPGAGKDLKKQRKNKDEEVRVHQAPGPGAYFKDGLSGGGPSFSISEPLKKRIKPSPGPGAYLAETYDPKRKPKTPTFGKSSRFGGAAVAAKAADDAAFTERKALPKRASTPGPGYYNVAVYERKQDAHVGSSSTCPDVIGWMKKRREVQEKNHQEFQEIHRKMVIMGTEDTEALNKLLNTDVVIPRPKGVKRQIWR